MRLLWSALQSPSFASVEAIRRLRALAVDAKVDSCNVGALWTPENVAFLKNLDAEGLLFDVIYFRTMLLFLE